MKMASRYWGWSGFAALGAIVMAGCVLWLDAASSKRVSIPPPSPPSTIFGATGAPPFKRQDVDALLVIDFSGSMRGTEDIEATDPNDLRLAAADLMITSLAADVFPRATRMGYIAFGKEAVPIRPLESVEDPAVRKELISSLGTPEYTEYTDIAGALKLAYQELFPNNQQASTNIPSLILLTDGDPRGGGPDNNEAGIRAAIQKLTDKGTSIFVIILRNPDIAREDPRLTQWRDIWLDIDRRNPQVTYFETQQADQLEQIYNEIRGRLISEGAGSSERLVYDPADKNAAIRMPPNLLKANLLVSRPRAISRIELKAPNGKTFEVLAQEDKLNTLFSGDLYDRYTLHLPETGTWTLETDSQQPIYYVLNPESLYSARIAWPAGSPYVSPDKATNLPLIVIDRDGKITDKSFDLQAAVIRNVKQPNSAIVEEQTLLPKPEPQPQSNGQLTYRTQVSPDAIGEDNTVLVRISGQADDGTLVNVALIRLPTARAPEDLTLQIPNRVICSDEKLIFWPPEIRCSNEVTATLQIQAADRLRPNTLVARLFSPGRSDGEPMQLAQGPGTFQKRFGPLLTAGNYGVAADAQGQVGDGLSWGGQATATIELMWPAWVPKWRSQLLIGAVLLAICAFWKPLIVWLLLRLFRLFRLAPSGFYKESGDPYHPDEVYPTAAKKRKLFTLTLGRWENKGLDVTVSKDNPPPISYSRRGIRRFIPEMGEWLYKRPQARLLMLPFLCQ
jgi:hypothetical protein